MSAEPLSIAQLGAEPEWLAPLYPRARQPAANTNAEPLADLDLPSSIDRAISWLRDHAPEAVEGAGGDHATYEVCARMRDFGLSEATAFDVVAEHWNEAGKAFPPWSAEDLQTKVGNAYRYGSGAIGQALGVAEFDDATAGMTIGETEGQTKPRFGEWVEPFDSTKIPKRAWVLGHLLAQGFVTGLVAPSGAGKTTLEIQIALALATGRGDIVGLEVKKRCRVFLWNQEDELDELKRRLAAAMLAFGVSFDDLHLDGRPALIIGSGVDNALMVARRGPTAIVATEAAQALTEQFLADGIGVAMFDPFVELHPADENNNVEISQVARVFRRMAVAARAAVLLVHHTRKPPSGEATGHAGNMDSGRGAGSLIGVTRMGATLYGVDEKTADKFGIAEDERHRYVRLDDGKNNLALADAEPHFYRREGVNIGTFEDPEEVGVLRPVVLGRKKSAADRRAEDIIEAVLGVVGEQAAMPVIDIARALVASDIMFSDANADALCKSIKRLLSEEKLSGFGVEERTIGGRKGRVATMIALRTKPTADTSETPTADSREAEKQ